MQTSGDDSSAAPGSSALRTPPLSLIVVASDGAQTRVPTRSHSSHASSPSSSSPFSQERQKSWATAVMQSRQQGGGSYKQAPVPREAAPTVVHRCCTPASLAGNVTLPLWRTLLTLAFSLLFCALLDVAWEAPLPLGLRARHAWAFCWPLVQIAILCEGLFIVNSVFNEQAQGVLHGMASLARLLDVCLAFALAFGNVFMIFYVLDVHAVHFRGFTIAPDASALEAWSHFAYFSVTAFAGGGIVDLDPVTTLARFTLASHMTLMFAFVNLVFFCGVAEVSARRDARRVQ